MSFRTASLMLVMLLVCSAAYADAPTVDARGTPRDYASGIPFSPKPGLAVQTLLLPLAVYRGARADLSDLAVFDADGRPVPFAVRAVEKLSENKRHEQALSFFPIHARREAEASALALEVERSSDGTVIAVRTPGTARPAAAQGDEAVRAYIVHTGARDEELSALRFELAPTRTNFVLELKVEGSDDLASWRVLSQGEAIGRLAHDGTSVERSRVALAKTRAAFLRISWPSELPAPIEKVFGESERVETATPLAPEHVEIGPVALADGAYPIDLGGTLPLESITPALPEERMLQATLLANDSESLRTLFDGQIYRLKHGATVLSSGAIPLAGTRARLLSLRIDSRASAPPKEPLSFDVAYAPDQLLFIAHGSAEHLLAFGSYRRASAPFAADALLSFLTPEQKRELPLVSAHAGAQRTLGGPAARTPPKPGFPVQSAVLWGVLVLGAGTLILLALRLLKKSERA